KCYWMLDRYGLSDLVSSHVSYRQPQDRNVFVSARFGVMSNKVEDSDLREFNLSKEWTEEVEISPSAAKLHSAIYRSRPDIQCIIHTHGPDIVAFSATGQHIRPISQSALPFFERTSYAR